MEKRSIWKRLLGSTATAIALTLGCSAQGPEQAAANDAPSGKDEFGSIQQALGTCTAVELTSDVASPARGGAAVTVTATPSGCSKPRFRFDFRFLDTDTGIWSPWTLLQKGKSPAVGPMVASDFQIQLRVKVKEKGASSWESSNKLNFEWGPYLVGSCYGVCGGASSDCGCDDECDERGDCCSDFNERCGVDLCEQGWDCNLGTGNVGCDESCVTDPSAGLGAFCAKIVEGGQTCAGVSSCAATTACSVSADCPDGHVCSPDTCCGTPVCVAAFCPEAPAEAAALQSLDGPTTATR